MALTGLQIFKYLPGGKKEKESNCKKCGFPTCMAFAMKLAKNEVEIDKCEYISDELKSLLEESSQVQQVEITFGNDLNTVKTGNETVMFRHDKKFVNPTCLAVSLKSSDPDFDLKLNEILNYSVERVGENLVIDAVALIDDGKQFIEKAEKLYKSQKPAILVSSDVENLKKAVSIFENSKPLVYLKDAEVERVIELDKEFNVPIIISASSLKELVDYAAKAVDQKLNNIVLDLKGSTNKLIEDLTFIRRSAIENKFKPLGFPVISFMDEIQGLNADIIESTIWASALMCKYSNIIVLDNFDKALVYSLLTLRQNIYTDPQKPLQIEPKIYAIGDVGKNSPVVVTTNFALTYFSVVGEIESSNVPTYLLITPSDGMSVLTAWAASKFTGEMIAKAVKNSNLESLLDHKKIIIPGYVGNLKEEIEEELPGWEVIIGANDAVDIPDFLKEFNAQLAVS